jgi:hypothetical protein
VFLRSRREAGSLERARFLQLVADRVGQAKMLSRILGAQQALAILRGSYGPLAGFWTHVPVGIAVIWCPATPLLRP